MNPNKELISFKKRRFRIRNERSRGLDGQRGVKSTEICGVTEIVAELISPTPPDIANQATSATVLDLLKV